MQSTPTKYAGADWLKANGKTLSPLGERVADLIGQLTAGIYHIEKEALKADWANEWFIELRFPTNGLATFDFNQLTILVVLCHEAAIRCAINPVRSLRPRHVQLLFHQRQREGWFSERHPTIEEAVKMVRECLVVPEVCFEQTPAKETR
jgi:hypothetical protein